MAFTRIVATPSPVDSEVLTSRMVGIGMNFASTPVSDSNIEDTILLASVEGMERHDLRVLAVLVTWFGIHAPWVNADRLTKLVAAEASARVRALWSALALWQKKDRRFVRLSELYAGPRYDVVGAGTDYQVKRHGEDSRFESSSIQVAANVLRDRAADVLQPAVLAGRHLAYRYRIMMGPNYRADMWAALERSPEISAAALARSTYGSFASAWRVRRDFILLRSASSARRSFREGRGRSARSA